MNGLINLKESPTQVKFKAEKTRKVLSKHWSWLTSAVTSNLSYKPLESLFSSMIPTVPISFTQLCQLVGEYLSQGKELLAIQMKITQYFSEFPEIKAKI